MQNTYPFHRINLAVIQRPSINYKVTQYYVMLTFVPVERIVFVNESARNADVPYNRLWTIPHMR